MKTTDFKIEVTSAKLHENLEKQFGSRVNLEKYNREQLEDIRNKFRTRIFQHESTAKINDLLSNESYQKDKAMLELLNTRIKEMLGEQMKQLRDKIDALNEGKKSFKNKIHPKGSKGSKPDFLDIDKDGDKKEPMKKAAKDVAEANDGNLANNAKPYDKVTRGDVIAGRLGKDEEGGKKKTAKVKETAEKTSERDIEMKKQGGGTVKVKATQYKGHQSKAADKDDKKDKDLDEAKAHAKDCDCNECMSVYEGDFKNLEKKLEKKGAKNPGGLAKYIGDKKYGKAEMEKKAAAGRKKANESFKHNVRFVNESIDWLLNEDEEGKAKAITAAGDIVNDYTSWMQRVGQYQTKSMIELADAIRADFGAAEAEAFKNAVGPALSQTLETLTQQREAVSNAVAVLAGEAAPEEPMGMDPNAGMDAGLDVTAPDDMNPEPGADLGDEFAAADASSSNREMRESKQEARARKLAESHSIIAKLAK
jgi:hypothetical protein